MEQLADRPFDRALGDQFRAQLIEEAQRDPSWWRDVLLDPGLVVALRKTMVNVYWRGQSIFNVSQGLLRPKASTHEKYLLDKDLKGQVPFDGETFDVAKLKERAFVTHYEPGGPGLKRLKEAAEHYSGPEKSGCHDVTTADRSIIDVEIALPTTIKRKDKDVKNPRIDLLALESSGADEARLVFWEAKDFSNPELGSPRSISKSFPVLDQVESYQRVIHSYRSQIESSYAAVCKDLWEIRRAAGVDVHDLVRAVATGERRLVIDERPRVNLLVMGFNEAQKAAWKEHKKALAAALRERECYVRAVGKPGKKTRLCHYR